MHTSTGKWFGLGLDLGCFFFLEGCILLSFAQLISKYVPVGGSREAIVIHVEWAFEKFLTSY